MWFERLMGFAEESPTQVRENIVLDQGVLRSNVNNRTFRYGKLTTPILGDLRSQASLSTSKGNLSISEAVGDVQLMHRNALNQGAFFQVASQFNLLEMVDPSVSPEQGVGIYSFDRTQGPACAIACGAGTIYRNYFAPVGGQIGQSRNNQIDCLAAIGQVLGNKDDRLWKMTNGYMLPRKTGLSEISAQIGSMKPQELDSLKCKLQIGLQQDTQVTIFDCEHTVTQAYCSAVPVSYSGLNEDEWEPFARLVLEATYEATLLAALLNAEKTGNNKVFLTLIGGGAFGNPVSWILEALSKALAKVIDKPLDIIMVSYGKQNPHLASLLESIN